MWHRVSHIVTYNRELHYLDICEISKHVTYLVLQIHHKFVTPKYHPLLCRFVVTQYWDEFLKAIWEMADRDVILTPILCMEVTKSSGNKLERFGKNLKNWLLKLTKGRGASGWQIHTKSVFIQFWTFLTAK